MDGSGIVIHFANGDAFFTGSALLVASACLFLTRGGRWVKLAARLGVLIAAILIAVSGTPLPTWAYLLWAAAAAWLLVAPSFAPPWRISRLSVLAVIFLTTAFCVWEGAHHTSPVVLVPRGQSILIIGDSITAGLNDDVTKWHHSLGRQGGYPIVDLAHAGATQESVLSLLRKEVAIGAKLPLAILEIGGNDMLAKQAPEEFEHRLDDLLAETSARAGTVLIMELPTPPFYNAYGAIQRRLARKHGVILLSKRVFARVLAAPDATIDGLHLSQRGHDLMARETGQIVHE